MIKRPNINEYFINIAKVVSTRSSCITQQVGAVIAKDKVIISTGFNGTVRGVKNCNEGGCKRCLDRSIGIIKSGEKLDECTCVHAEQNAIIQAALHGVSTKDATLYSTHCPCRICSLLIVQAGIVKVFYNKSYSLDDVAFKIFLEANVEIEKYG